MKDENAWIPAKDITFLLSTRLKWLVKSLSNDLSQIRFSKGISFRFSHLYLVKLHIFHLDQCNSYLRNKPMLISYQNGFCYAIKQSILVKTSLGWYVQFTCVQLKKSPVPRKEESEDFKNISISLGLDLFWSSFHLWKTDLVRLFYVDRRLRSYWSYDCFPI